MICNICPLCLILLATVRSGSLPSDLHQSTSGVYFERWISTTEYSMSNFNSIPNYPDVPSSILHFDAFSYSDVYFGYKQYGRFRASFVSDQTGLHKFFAILNNKAQIYIELNPNGMKKILDIGFLTNDDWKYRTWCDDVSLVKGFRYKITVYYFGNGQQPDFFRLGVKFPDNAEVRPITSTYLQSSTADNAINISLPIPEMLNSTAISVKLLSTPYLPPIYNWTYVEHHEILYHRNGIEETPKKLIVIGTLPQTVIATGLKKYTDYVFYAYYFGKIKGEDQNIITRYSAVVKTDEDAPDGSPTSINGRFANQTAIYVTWNTIPILYRNGIIQSYIIAYKQKHSSEDWSVISVDAQKSRVEICHLQYNTIYDVKVAGRTSIGQGPYSVVISIRKDAYGEFYTGIHYTNKALKNHIVKRKDVESLADCFSQCLQCDMEDGCTCSSINFSHFQIDNKNVCEINDAAHNEHLSDFVSRPGFQYYERHY